MAVGHGESKRLAAEQRSRLESLLDEIGPRIVAYVRAKYGRLCDAEEVLAETFCRAAANMAAVERSEHAALYLFTIAKNLCRDRFRRQRPEVDADERLIEQPAPASEPSESVAGDEARVRLLAAVEQLPESFREVVVLRMSAGLKFEEIAELLHIPIGTALSRMHSALQRLREQLTCSHER